MGYSDLKKDELVTELRVRDEQIKDLNEDVDNLKRELGEYKDKWEFVIECLKVPHSVSVNKLNWIRQEFWCHANEELFRAKVPRFWTRDESAHGLPGGESQADQLMWRAIARSQLSAIVLQYMGWQGYTHEFVFDALRVVDSDLTELNEEAEG